MRHDNPFLVVAQQGAPADALPRAAELGRWLHITRTFGGITCLFQQ